nr:TMV resistance protein N-like [Ipomoea batatas]
MVAVSSPCACHVYLSYRGTNTCLEFIDLLHRELTRAGFQTFKKHNQLEKGKICGPEWRKVVKDSRVSIIVFSKDYAYSRRCLDELVNILERKKNAGHMILPVFYNVDPSHVRKQTGCYADAFRKYEEQCVTEMGQKMECIARVKKWRASLKEAADLAGMVLEDRDDLKFIQDIVEEIWHKLSRSILNVAPHPVGMYPRGTEFVEGLVLKLDELKDYNADKLGISSKRPHCNDASDPSSTLVFGGNLSKRHCLGFCSWIPVRSALATATIGANEGDLTTRALSRMHDLRLLELYNVRLSGVYDGFPKKLRWLCWHGFQLNSMPNSIPLDNLVVLEMQNSSMQQIWEGTKNLRSLKVLDVKLGFTKWTDSFRLTYFWSWTWVSLRPKSGSAILELLQHDLRVLDLSDCNLTEKTIPNDLSVLSSLQYLNLSKNPISKLPESIRSLTMLLSLMLSSCTRLQSIPKLPSRLRILDANGCRSLERIANLPNFLKSLDLKLEDCGKLVEVEGIFMLKHIEDMDEMFNIWSLCDIKPEAEGSAVGVELHNSLTSTTTKAPPVQGLYEFGIFSMFLPGSKVPRKFNKKSIGSPISFSIPSGCSVEMHGLNICVVYEQCSEELCGESLYITVSNKSKGIKWIYSPVLSAVTGPRNTVHYSSHLHHAVDGDLSVFEMNPDVYLLSLKS